MSNAVEALGRIQMARRYSSNLLNNVPTKDWFRMPKEGVTHLGWQVGHLAMSQYRLTLERIRGKRPEDDRLIPASYVELFGKGSTPNADPGAYPPIEEIRRVFDAVHRQAETELAVTSDAALDAPTSPPHRIFNTKLEALHWCPQHEMLHAGQIGLLRRFLGLSPIW
jgi:hypothetical protein